AFEIWPYGYRINRTALLLDQALDSTCAKRLKTGCFFGHQDRVLRFRNHAGAPKFVYASHSKMALDDLHHVKDDMIAFIEGHGMRRFLGYVSDDVSSVMWENNGNTEGWKDFVELAKAAGVSFLTMNDVVLEREDIDFLIERLRTGNYTDEDDIEEARWLR